MATERNSRTLGEMCIRDSYKTIGLNWERMGNIRFAVTYKPQNDSLDRAYAKRCV